MIQRVKMSTMLCYRTPFSGKCYNIADGSHLLLNIEYRNLPCSARRNERGHLEPDAPDDVVQKSLGFDEYEHKPKPEERSK